MPSIRFRSFRSKALGALFALAVACGDDEPTGGGHEKTGGGSGTSGAGHSGDGGEPGTGGGAGRGGSGGTSGEGGNGEAGAGAGSGGTEGGGTAGRGGASGSEAGGASGESGGGGESGAGMGGGGSGPIRVTSVLDTTRAAFADVPLTGGSVTATAADGTVFTLTIPDGALLGETRVTLTPVASMTGLPHANGLLGAVDIQPLALELCRAATLRITLPQPTVARDVHGFEVMAPATASAASGVSPLVLEQAGSSGEAGSIPVEVVLDPSNPGDTTTIDLIVSDGGEHGSGSGGSGMNRPPSNSSGERRSQIADVLDAARAAGQDFSDPAVQAQLDAILDGAWPGIDAGLAAGETNAGRFRSGVRDFVRWWQEVELLGLDDAQNSMRIEQARDRIARGIVNAVNEAERRCRENSDPREALEMIELAKMADRLGVEGRVPGSTQAEIMQKAQDCASFELFIDEDFETTSDGETFGVRRRVNVPLALDTNELVFRSLAPIAWGFVSGFFPEPEGCLTNVAEGEPGQVDVVKAVPPLGSDLPRHAWRVLIDINLGRDDTPKENLTIDCRAIEGPFVTQPSTLWLPAWEAHYMARRAPALEAWSIVDFVAGDALIIAQRIVSGLSVSRAGSTFVENASWDIRHTPR